MNRFYAIGGAIRYVLSTLFITTLSSAAFAITTSMDSIVEPTIEDVIGMAFEVSGQVRTAINQPMKEVTFALQNGTSTTTLSGDIGKYVFPEVALGTDFTLTANLDDSSENGLTTEDAMLVAYYMLGQGNLTPYQKIAADMNGSGGISTFDIIMINRILLGVSTLGPDFKPWVFVPADFDVSGDFNLADVPTSINVEGLEENLDMDWVAIKKGDIDYTATFNYMEIDDRSLEQKAITIQDRWLEAGATFLLPVSLEGVAGMQGTIEVDPALAEVTELVYGLAGPMMFNEHFLEDGQLRFSWIGTATDAPLFSLRLKANQRVKLSEVLRFADAPLRSEVYPSLGEKRSLVFEFLPVPGDMMAQVQPNPMRGQGWLQVDSPGTQSGELEILTLNGRRLSAQKVSLVTGRQQLPITVTNGAGTYLYRIQTSDAVLSGKFIVE